MPPLPGRPGIPLARKRTRTAPAADHFRCPAGGVPKWSGPVGSTYTVPRGIIRTQQWQTRTAVARSEIWKPVTMNCVNDPRPPGHRIHWPAAFWGVARSDPGHATAARRGIGLTPMRRRPCGGTAPCSSRGRHRLATPGQGRGTIHVRPKKPPQSQPSLSSCGERAYRLCTPSQSLAP